MKKSLFLLLLILTGCADLGGFAPVERRFISLRHPPSGESVYGDYIREGRYDRSMLRRISHLCRDRHNDKEQAVDPKMIDFIADMRDRVGLPETATFDVLSCYRSPETNGKLARVDPSIAKESWHMKGRAVDLRVPFLTGKAMAEIAKTMQRGGVAFYPKSGHVHIDTGEARTWAVR